MKGILFSLLCVFGILTATAQVGINNTNPDPSSALDIKSTNSGILIPRMKETERDAISDPATGLMIFQTNNTPGFYYYDSTAWKPFTGETHWEAADDNIYNANNGNVGIGTADPTAKLHVAGTSSAPTALVDQDFENYDNSFTSTGGAQRFTVKSNDAYNTANSGTKCMRTGTFVGMGNTLTLTREVNIPAGGATVSFYYNIKAYNALNTLKFYIDDVEQESLSADVGWANFRGTIAEPGNRTLKWEYHKGYNPFNPDGASIDDVLVKTAGSGVLRLEDGSEGLGKVLISDNEGNASWRELTNETIIDIPLLAAFGGMEIPICDDVVVGQTFEIVDPILIRGVNTTVTWTILKRVLSSPSFPLDAERLQVKYEFSPPLPFEPAGLIFSANNNSSHPDTFSLNYASKSQSSIIMNITRNDKFGDYRPPVECWQGEFFFDVFLLSF